MTSMEKRLDAMFQKLCRGQQCSCCHAAARQSMYAAPGTPAFKYLPQPATAMHHIIHRADKTLRHDWRNGLPVCADCHLRIHNEAGFDVWVTSAVIGAARMQFLWDLSRGGLKRLLLKLGGLTEAEWLKIKESEMNEQLDGDVRYNCTSADLPF